MTHTNHRTGAFNSLSKDWVVFMYAAKGVNSQGVGAKLQEFLRLAMKHNPVNFGSPTNGNKFTTSTEKLMSGLASSTKVYIVFDSRENATAFIKDAEEASLGISVIVSGLFDEVGKICDEVGLTRHTAQCSLGVWGKTGLLPPAEVMDITTMCGHALVATGLVERMAAEVKTGKTSVEKAAITLSKPCICGVFNTKRAEQLLKRYVDLGGVTHEKMI
jgi:hypothetical protein